MLITHELLMKRTPPNWIGQSLPDFILVFDRLHPAGLDVAPLFFGTDEAASNLWAGMFLSGLRTHFIGVAIQLGLLPSRIRCGLHLRGKCIDQLLCRRANFSGQSLEGANLEYSDLAHSDLSSAHLGKTRLYRACLYGVDLSNADLRGADLRGADLRGSTLDGANLTKCKLFGAANNYNKADLRRASIVGANGLNPNTPKRCRCDGAFIHDDDTELER